ncbi:MAG: HEAT repeat domain-containing protein, partial [Phycisphaerales bacterium]
RGTEQAFKFLHEQATAYGPIYDNPYHDSPDSGDPVEFGRSQSMVVAGGKVTASRDIELVLNQSSYSRSRAIADRINERLGRADDRVSLANPLTDQLIKITVPPRYQANPGEMVDLIMHLYLQTGPGFEQDQARRLADVLRQQPDTAESVGLAWRSLGRPIVEVLREYYNDEVLTVRMAALKAGAWLDDERASQSLSELATSDDPAIRTEVAEALVLLPRSIKGARALKGLLDDEEMAVRIAAYESLSAINDPMIATGRVMVADEPTTGIKYIIDTVPSEKPLVYITQVGVPRIAIFSPDLGFEAPMLARMWDNRLMLSRDRGQDYLSVFYQPFRTDADSPSSVKLKTVPDLKTLIYVLGHKPTAEQPNEGLGLTYSQAVDVVYQLCRREHVKAPIEVRVSGLARQIADFERDNAPVTRPETDPGAVEDGGLSRADTAPATDPMVRPDTADPQTTSTR